MSHTAGLPAQHDDDRIPHLPDPSPWPFVAGIGVFLLGGAFIWWLTSDNVFAAPALGGAVVTMLAAVGGWAYEDSRMRRAAEAQSHGHPEHRFNQAMTFLVPAGQIEAVRRSLLPAIEAAHSRLHDSAGFLDLRINVAPGVDGDAHVLVETEWTDAGALTGYEESRQTLLDLLLPFPDQVVPGSVQVFDMEVIRDTKDTTPRVGLGAMASLVGAFAVGALALGAGIAMFEGGQGAAEGGGGGDATPTPPAAFQGVIVAEKVLFVQEEFQLPPGVEVTLQMDNRDPGIPHNIAFYQSSTAGEGGFLQGCTSGCEPADPGASDVRTAIESGPIVQTFTFTTPSTPGEYGYLCEVHPSTMVGVMTIQEGAPVPTVAN